MGDILHPDFLATLATSAQTWVMDELLTLASLVQLLVIAAAYLLARLVAPHLRKMIEGLRPLGNGGRRALAAVSLLVLPIGWLVLQWLSVLVASAADWPARLIELTVSLLTAWVVIRLASNLIRDPVWSRLMAIVAWTIAALNVVGLLGPTIELLDGLSVTFGSSLRISVLSVIKGMITLGVLLWAATAFSRIMERRINSLPNLTPSVQVLIGKLLKFTLLIFAVLAAIASVGIDLTALAVFSGALGLGIGFGLQKSVSNLISGIMLLLDKSIKPGDVIGVADTYGWIKSLGARYVSVVTRDGIEHLIPNEDLIVQRVENWSYSNSKVRLRIPIGISYGADPRRAIALCLEAAAETNRVIPEPKSVCLLTGFGDSSVDLELRIWIEDPQNGVSNVKSDVLLNVWDKFHAAGIEIPFPQRDLHIRTPEVVRVASSAQVEPVQ